LSGIVAVSFKHDPESCLTDILDDIARIERFTTGMTREALASNEMAIYAVERALQRVCEAFSRLGSRAAELFPGQSSSAIRGMGNRLRHAYDAIDLDVIWDTIRSRLPSLKADAEGALATLRAGRPGSEGDPR
jgi:uncharacterized protein with HEPN domain